MTTPLKTGMAVMTKITIHACRIITKFRPTMDTVIDGAVGSGSITSAQATELKLWLDGVAGACAILKAITHY